jgi:hypothetical protein
MRTLTSKDALFRRVEKEMNTILLFDIWTYNISLIQAEA